MTDDKNPETSKSKRWHLRFAWTDGIATARMSVTVDLPNGDPAGSPLAMIQRIADKFHIPLSKCTEASAELVERCGDDDMPF